VSTPEWRSRLGLGISSIKGDWESSKAEAGFLPTMMIKNKLNNVSIICKNKYHGQKNMVTI
jgi:hypothetical protein